MERLRFDPRGLKGVLGGPSAERRFRNNEAAVVVWDAAGNVVKTDEGLLVDIAQATTDLLNGNEDLRALIFGYNNCTGFGSIPPTTLTYKKEMFE